MKIYIILGLAALVAVFFLQNTEIVDIRFLFWQLSVSRVALLFASLAVGFVAGVLTTLEVRRKKAPQEGSHRKRSE